MTPLPQNNDLATIQDEKTSAGNQLFPVFLKLNNLHTVLIGAGNVGLEKLTAVLNNSQQAKVTVIAENVIPAVYDLANEFENISIVQKSFIDTDLAEIIYRQPFYNCIFARLTSHWKTKHRILGDTVPSV